MTTALWRIPMKFRCFHIETTGDPAPEFVIVELDDGEIAEDADDLKEAIHEVLFESGIDGHLVEFDYEPVK